MDKNVLTTATAEPEIQCVRYGQLVPHNRWEEAEVLSTTISGYGDCFSLRVPLRQRPGRTWQEA
jgi:hypothetical protein